MTGTRRWAAFHGILWLVSMSPGCGSPGAGECAVDADCGAPTACTQPKCGTDVYAGQCFVVHSVAGTSAPPVVAGDCAKEVCDGAGNIVLAENGNDPPPGAACVSPTACAPPDPDHQGGDLLWSKEILAPCEVWGPPLQAVDEPRLGLLVGPTGDALPTFYCKSEPATLYRRITGAGLLVGGGILLIAARESGEGTWMTADNTLVLQRYYSLSAAEERTIRREDQQGYVWKSKGTATVDDARAAKFSHTAIDHLGNIFTLATSNTSYAQELSATTTLPGPGTYLLRDGVSGAGMLAGVTESPLVPDETGGALLLVSPALAQQLGCSIGPTSAGTAAIRLDSTWACRWAVPFDANDPSLVADGSGGVVISASAPGTVDLGCGALAAVPTGSTFITHLDASGACAFAMSLPLPDLRVDRTPSGVLVSGAAGASAVDLGGGSLAALGSEDLVLAAYDGAGHHLWSRRAGGPGLSFAKAEVTALVSGGVAVTVQYDGTADLGGGPVAATSKQITMASYAASGDHRWSRAIDLAPGEGARVDPCGGLYTTAYVDVAPTVDAPNPSDHYRVSRYQP